VFFWPKDFTFVCPTEIAAFGKLAGDFADRDTVVYGGAIDSKLVHRHWRLDHDDVRALPNPMPADVKREPATVTVALGKAEGLARGRRSWSIRTGSSAARRRMTSWWDATRPRPDAWQNKPASGSRADSTTPMRPMSGFPVR
jgi:hypothetical protein